VSGGALGLGAGLAAKASVAISSGKACRKCIVYNSSPQDLRIGVADSMFDAQAVSFQRSAISYHL
jgi:hypothetical protein